MEILKGLLPFVNGFFARRRNFFWPPCFSRSFGEIFYNGLFKNQLHSEPLARQIAFGNKMGYPTPCDSKPIGHLLGRQEIVEVHFHRGYCTQPLRFIKTRRHG